MIVFSLCMLSCSNRGLKWQVFATTSMCREICMYVIFFKVYTMVTTFFQEYGNKSTQATMPLIQRCFMVSARVIVQQGWNGLLYQPTCKHERRTSPERIAYL